MNYYYYEANSYAEFTVQTKEGERGNSWHIQAGTAIAVDDSRRNAGNRKTGMGCVRCRL